MEENYETQTYGKSSSACITPVQQMLASCSGAMLTTLFVTPLDVIKVRLQVQEKSLGGSARGTVVLSQNSLMENLCICSHCNTDGTSAFPKRWYERNGRFTGTFDAFMKITRAEGFRSLWSGLSPTMVMAVPSTVVYFTSYDQLKVILGYKESDPSTRFIPLIAGTSARFFAATLISPLELIRTKIQSERLSYFQVGQAIRKSVANGGLRTLMRGLGPTLLRDIPFSAIYWFSYELAKSKHLNRRDARQLTFIESFTSGAMAGTIAAILTCPFDVIKTHRQMELGEVEVLKTKQVSSTWLLIARLYYRQGLRALFAGLVPRISRVAPACAIMISTYEYGKAFFRDRNALRGKQAHKLELS